MLVMRTVEGCAYPLGQFVGRQQPFGLDHPTLAVNPLRFYRVQPRTLLRQKAANDPDALAAPFDLSRELWEVIQVRTWSSLMCQLALSQISTHTFLPTAASLSEHHSRKRVVMPLTGRPSTKRNHTSSNSGTKARSRRWPWYRGRLWGSTAPPSAGACLLR